MAKKITTLILIIIALIIGLMLILPKGTKDKNFLEVRLYDAHGNLIGTTETFSIVNGVQGVASFDITINVLNTGSQILSCTPNTITPTQFDSALTKTAKNVLAGNTISWTSAKITASQFEAAPTPDVFSASVTCTWTGSPITKSGSISLTIVPDASGADFTISLSPGGLGTEWCGDGVCQPPLEDATTCAKDCTVTTRARFRTSDLSYISGSAIAYNATGNCKTISALSAYGWSYIYQGGADTTCSVNMPAICGSPVCVLLVSNLPGGWRTGGAAPSLWQGGGKMWVCDDAGAGQRMEYTEYTLGDPDGVKVSTSIVSINSPLEVAC